MNRITAPYNFVPLAPWVFEPYPGQPVTHDLPYAEGISGTLEYTLTAHTPLLVGGEQEKDGQGRTQVRFFHLPNNGKPAIPGSSIRGMIRNVLEIAAFGRMRLVDDKRFGLRDISGGHVKDVYRKQIFGSDDNNQSHPQAGFLHRLDNGSPEIIPCQFTRISHGTIEKELDITCNFFSKGKTVPQKYQIWHEIASSLGLPAVRDDLPPIRFSVGDMLVPNIDRVSDSDPKWIVDPKHRDNGATELGKGALAGWLVFTGQISDTTDTSKKGGKYKDFVFYAPNSEASLNGEKLSPSIWEAFRHIHGDHGLPHKHIESNERPQKAQPTRQPWMDLWKDRYYQRKRVPVFYRLDEQGRVESMGLAYMYKLACKYSVRDIIDHTSLAHRQQNFPDLPDLLFGTVGETGKSHDESLRGRVSFGLLQIAGDPSPPLTQKPTILNNPKPSYFPNYLIQPSRDGLYLTPSANSGKTQYNTYADEKAQMRGWKRYPVRHDWSVQELEEINLRNPKVQVSLHPLPEKTRFQGNVRFHNLRPAELGALIWAMTWGGEKGKYHALGMGRPFGFGQISLEFGKISLTPNRPDGKTGEIASYMNEFIAIMEEACNKHGGKKWQETPQMVNLLAMADPEQASGHILHHMPLKDYSFAKTRGMILPSYLTPIREPTRIGGGTVDVGRAKANPRTPSPWLDMTIDQRLKDITTKPDEILASEWLAQNWAELTEPEIKLAAYREIVRRWRERGWWEASHFGRSQRKAKTIYDTHCPPHP